MKKTLFGLLILTLGTTVQAQDIDIKNGAQFLMNKRSEQFERILNTDPEDFSFLTKSGIKKFRVMSLDEKLKVDVSKELELMEVNKKEVKFVDASQIGDQTYFFSQSFDKKADEMNLFASDLNLAKGKFDKHYEAMNVKDDKFGIFQRPFKVVRSIDSSRVLFVCTYPTKGKEKARVALKVTDNELNEIWKKDVVFDQLDKDLTVLEYLVDKDGNIHISASIRMDNKEKKEKGAKGRYYVSIYSYFHESGELKEYEIGFKDEIILTSHLELNHNNEIICTGFYGEKKVFDAGMKGFYYLRIDPASKQVVAKNLSPFDKKFLGELMNERRAEKGKSLMGYLVRKTYAMKDGGMTVVCEYYDYTEIRDSDGNVVKQIWTFGNVLVFFLDAEGKMKTYSILKKNQTCSTKGTIGTLAALAGATPVPGVNELPYYGIGTMMKNDNLYLIYNENPKNAERLKSGKKPKSVREATSVTNLVTFTRDGEIHSNTLFKSKDKEGGYRMPLMPTFHFNHSENSMLVIGRRGKKARVTQITIND